MVARRRLHRASGEWQSCALRATGILGSQILLDSAPDSVDDVVITLLPLLFVGRHGNQFVSDVGNVLVTSALGRTHPLLVGMEAVIASEGEWSLPSIDNEPPSKYALTAKHELLIRAHQVMLSPAERKTR